MPLIRMASIIDHGRFARPDPTFDAIAATIAETSRGRWFLAEFARRSRTADTEMLLTALGRIESAMRLRHDPHLEPGIPAEGTLAAARAELDGAHRELARIASAADQPRPPDTVADELEASTAEILDGAESIQDASWILRDRGADPALCDGLDRQAASIYAACARQDLAAQRALTLARTLHRLDEILAADAPARRSAATRLPPPRS